MCSGFFIPLHHFHLSVTVNFYGYPNFVIFQFDKLVNVFRGG
jgi:hypothetical protein